MRKRNTGVKLRQLTVKNFKALDSITIEFPPPRMNNDPDIMVMGSRNGLGKTSVLEACALLFLAVVLEKEGFRNWLQPEMPLDLNDLLVRAGANQASIKGDFHLGAKVVPVSLTLTRGGNAHVDGDVTILRKQIEQSRLTIQAARERAQSFLSSLVGLNTEPLLLTPFLYFHSYRKVQEGNPELGMMVEREYYRFVRHRARSEMPVSTFKLEILRSMMSQGGLFEDFDDVAAGTVLQTLNDLVEEYAGGHIEKLRTAPDNTIEFRIAPRDGGPSFTFDGLSSGQKEIISTLFLIWQYTRTQPGIVLIDEPELHLNVEWHHKFIRCLHRLSPQNQYIVATHSEDVFASVETDRRLLLAPVREG